MLLTEASQPPRISALSLRTFEMTTVIEYGVEDLAVFGVSERAGGAPRTWRRGECHRLQQHTPRVEQRRLHP